MANIGFSNEPGTDVKWHGFKAMEIALTKLPEAFKRNQLSKIFARSLTPTRAAMKKNVPPNVSGALYQSIGTTKVDNTPYGFGVGAIVGPRRKRGDARAQGWHGHLVELGTRAHTIRSRYSEKPLAVYIRGKLIGNFPAVEVGPSPAQFPFQKAIESTKDYVRSYLVDQFQGIMSKHVAQIFRQYGEDSRDNYKFGAASWKKYASNKNRA